MNKKIIALILILPFVALYLIFSVSTAVALQIDIPVTGIEILNDLDEGTVFFDLANLTEFKLEVAVLPTKAKNRGFSVTFSPADSKSEFAQLTFDQQTGIITPHSVGKAKITAKSHDGGFSDIIIAVVSTTKPVSMQLSINDLIGDTLHSSTQPSWNANLTTGEYTFVANPFPAFADSVVTFSSSDNSKIRLDQTTGQAQILSSGKATVTASTLGAFGTLYSTVELDISQAQTESGITIDGQTNKNILLAKSQNTISLNVIVEIAQSVSGIPTLSGVDLPLIESHTFTRIITNTKNNSYVYSLSLKFNGTALNQLDLAVTAGTSTEPFTITLSDYKFELFKMSGYNYVDGALTQRLNSTVTYNIISTPKQENVQVIWSTTTTYAVKIESNDSPQAKITALTITEGKAVEIVQITARIFVDVSATSVPDYVEANGSPITFLIAITQNITNIEFALNQKQWGNTNAPAFGNKTIATNGEYVNHANEFPLTVFVDNISTQVDLSQFEFYAQNGTIASINVSNGVPMLNIATNGITSVFAQWKYQNPSERIIMSESAIEAVKDGVVVSTYEHLVRATEDKQKIVLAGNIMLGKPNATENELKVMTKELPITYSWKYHENKGRPQPTVRYAIEFANDLHGNGYYINGEYISMASDSTGTPLLFKGPVDFLEMEGYARAKTQDNILFLVRTDGVLINNVELMGCSDEAIEAEDSDSIDLAKLHRTGTVLEIASSAQILNCRIKNGRNTIRTYGGNRDSSNAILTAQNQIDLSSQRIKVRIDGCIISQSREFLIKMGSNNVILGTKQNYSPHLQVNGENVSNTNKNLYKNNDFYNQCVIADITLKNSVLSHSGLFCIGIDTYYSGGVLSGDLENKFDQLAHLFTDWINTGGTGFATVLRLEGDVRFYDWKTLDSLDSSTLIETVNIAQGLLNLDIRQIIKSSISVKGGDFNKILVADSGEEYLNTAIMKFGGGRNYAQIVFDNFSNEVLPCYSINANVLTKTNDETLIEQGTLVPMVIGNEDFDFYMYNSDSATSLFAQRQDFANGTAYAGVITAIR